MVPLREQGVEPHRGPDPPAPPTTSHASARPDTAQTDRPTTIRTSGTPADSHANKRPGEAARA
eukprot:4625713-Pleurochrysis_carterae.AAC.1